jgi:hypothetical protein
MDACADCHDAEIEAKEKYIEAQDVIISGQRKDIERLRAALEYIKGDFSNRECTCYEEKSVNFFLPCPYHAAKEALEATTSPEGT